MESDSCVGRPSKRQEFLRLETTPAYRPNSCRNFKNSWKPRGKSLCLADSRQHFRMCSLRRQKAHLPIQMIYQTCSLLSTPAPQATCFTTLSDIKW